MVQKHNSCTERGGALYGQLSGSNVIVTKIYDIVPAHSSSMHFSFLMSKVETENLIGFWHTHLSFWFHSPFDFFAYWKLKNKFQKKLIFVVFINSNSSFHTLCWEPDKIFPSLLSKRNVIMRCNWQEMIFYDK